MYTSVHLQWVYRPGRRTVTVTRGMELWLERAGPWLQVLQRGVTVTVQVVKGRPRLVAVAAIATLSSVAVYKYVTKNFDKWEKLGIPYEEGHFPYGSFNIGVISNMYKHLPEYHLKHCASSPYFGWFMFGQPVLNITDPEILRSILVKDFNSFVERSSYDGDFFKNGGKYDKLWGKQLTGLRGEEWKHVRATFSPIFTSGKMKGMLEFIKMTSDNMVEKFDESANCTDDVSLKVSHYTVVNDDLSIFRKSSAATPWTASPQLPSG